jgi:hypothetical protein
MTLIVIYAATLALYFAAALSKSSLFSARSTKNGCFASALRRDLVEPIGHQQTNPRIS